MASAVGWRAVAAGALALGMVACWSLGAGRGAARPAGEGKEEAKAPAKAYFGASACSNAGCHSSPPEKWLAGPLLCQCTEYKTWAENDRHASAYKVLEDDNPRARRMGERMKTRPTADPRCVNCHGVWIADAALRKASEEDNGFKVEEGVTCVACHGAHEEWVTRHSGALTARKWRRLSPEEKEKQGGLLNLRDPIRRAELCASCHVGNLAENKFVTHEMYAAGHPPLPGFEVTMFSEGMPRHWQLLRDKPNEKVRAELGYDGKERERATLLLVGAAVGLRESMRLLAKQAGDCAKATDPDRRALDLASFDCYSCHQDLRPRSRRPVRKYASRRPGRVPMALWQTVLVDLAVEHAAGDEAAARKMSAEYRAGLDKVHAGFESAPLGNPAKIAAAAHELGEWANKLAEALNRKDRKCDAEAVRKLRRRLPALYAGGSFDFDSARQVGWAYRALLEEAGPGDVPGPSELKVGRALDTALLLPLPPGKEPLEKGLKARLEAIYLFEPVTLGGIFRRLLGRREKR